MRSTRARILGCVASLALAGCAEAEQRGVYFVESYGALPNDGLDDTEGIQAAVRAAAFAGGGIVGLARGRYEIAGTVELGLANGVTLQGAGVDVTTIERTGAGPAFAVNAGARNQALADFTLTDGASAEEACLFHAPGPFPWTRSEIRRVKFTDYIDAVCLDLFEVDRLDRLEMVAAGPMGASIRVGKAADLPQGANLTIADSLIRGGALGVWILDADAVFMRNTDIGNVSFAALAIVPTHRSNNHTFSANFFDISGLASVLLGGDGEKNQILFADNWIASSALGVLIIDTGTYGRISFTGGRIFNHQQLGMDVEARSIDLLISGVQFEEIRGTCLRVATALNAVSALVSGSTFSACRSGVDVIAEPTANRFIANGNRGSGSIRCGSPMPGTRNWFDGGAPGC